MGEGAGVVVLESLEHALKRGADIYCEIIGYGASCDAHHITTPAPEGEGLGRAIKKSLEAGGVDDLKRVNYINAHGTSTNYNDKFETMAIKGVFGTDRAKDIMISSTKGVTGHTLGAAGGLEAIACIKAISTGSVPPTVNYETLIQSATYFTFQTQLSMGKTLMSPSLLILDLEGITLLLLFEVGLSKPAK